MDTPMPSNLYKPGTLAAGLLAASVERSRMRRCALCGNKADCVKVVRFPPDESRALGTPEGMHKTVTYALCNRCDESGGAERYEAEMFRSATRHREKIAAGLELVDGLYVRPGQEIPGWVREGFEAIRADRGEGPVSGAELRWGEWDTGRAVGLTTRDGEDIVMVDGDRPPDGVYGGIRFGPA